MSWINKYTPLGWMMSGYSKMFKWLDKKTGFSNRGNEIGSNLANALQPVVSNLEKYYAHTGATDQYKDEAAINFKNSMALQTQSQDWDEYMYNTYYSPSAQMRQYQEAGINPMIAFGNGAGITASGGASGGSASPGSSQGGDPLSAITGLISTMVGVKSAMANIEKTEAETEGKRIENKWKDRDWASIISERQSHINLMNKNVDKISADTALTNLYLEYYPELFSSQILQNNANARQLDALANKHASEIQLNEAEIKEIDSKIKLNEAKVREADRHIEKMLQEMITLSTQAALNDQMVHESSKRMEKYDAQIRQILAEAGLTEKEITYYVWNHSKDVSNSLGAGIKVHKEMFASESDPIVSSAISNN